MFIHVLDTALYLILKMDPDHRYVFRWMKKMEFKQLCGSFNKLKITTCVASMN